MSDALGTPAQDWNFLRSKRRLPFPRPGRFTLREVLVALSLGEERAHSYLETAFAWYFDRTRAVIFGAAAGAIGSASLFFHDGGFSTTKVVVIAAGLVLILASAGLFYNHQLSQLHREYLACLVLLRCLHGFGAEVASTMQARGQPPSITYRRRTTCAELRTWLSQASAPNAHEELGCDRAAWLFAALGPVPTARYERDREVRRHVQHLLDLLASWHKGSEAHAG